MSRCLRYRDPVICDHLASQYVTGQMKPRVRSRMQNLLRTTPELDRAVATWADSFAEVDRRLPERQPSANVWSGIDRAIAAATKAENKSSESAAPGFWQSLMLWRTTGFIGVAGSVVLAIVLVLSPASPTVSGPNYLAAMSSVSDANTLQFVITAYKKTEQQPSRIQLQWSDHKTVEVTETLHLWAEDRETNKLTYIGTQPSQNQPWFLTKPSWQAIANSGRLLMTTDTSKPSQSNLVFAGPCIQLKPWKKQTT